MRETSWKSMRLSGEKLSVDRGGRRVVESASFALRGGEALIVTGPNGAGKSTLLRALAGFLPLASGVRTFRPPAGTDADTPLAEMAHYLGHADALKVALTLRENLTFWAAILGSPHRPSGTVAEALERVALAHAADIPVGYLSAGQKRRAALARLLVARRPVWLLDEPSTALDTASLARLTAILRGHLGDGGIIIVATHVPLEVEEPYDLHLGIAG